MAIPTYVFAFDDLVAQSINEYIVHPSKEARCLRRNAIFDYQYDQQFKKLSQLNDAINALVKDRDRERSTDAAILINEMISDLWYEKIELQEYIENTDFDSTESLPLEHYLYFPHPASSSIIKKRTNRYFIDK